MNIYVLVQNGLLDVKNKHNIFVYVMFRKIIQMDSVKLFNINVHAIKKHFLVNQMIINVFVIYHV
jgi:hypothetical protein